MCKECIFYKLENEVGCVHFFGKELKLDAEKKNDCNFKEYNAK